jgi:hypothetical protein
MSGIAVWYGRSVLYRREHRDQPLDRWKEQIGSTYVKRSASCSSALVQLPSTRNKTDNNVLVVGKGEGQ